MRQKQYKNRFVKDCRVGRKSSAPRSRHKTGRSYEKPTSFLHRNVLTGRGATPRPPPSGSAVSRASPGSHFLREAFYTIEKSYYALLLSFRAFETRSRKILANTVCPPLAHIFIIDHGKSNRPLRSLCFLEDMGLPRRLSMVFLTALMCSHSAAAQVAESSTESWASVYSLPL